MKALKMYQEKVNWLYEINGNLMTIIYTFSMVYATTKNKIELKQYLCF